ncbi:hypothetical protein IGI01_11695 [Bacillus thuringiensis]|nr:hypothetical protein [Bacillus thuringiensis]
MTIHGIITLLIIFITFIILMCEKFPADIVMFSGQTLPSEFTRPEVAEMLMKGMKRNNAKD